MAKLWVSAGSRVVLAGYFIYMCNFQFSCYVSEMRQSGSSRRVCGWVGSVTPSPLFSHRRASGVKNQNTSTKKTSQTNQPTKKNPRNTKKQPPTTNKQQKTPTHTPHKQTNPKSPSRQTNATKNPSQSIFWWFYSMSQWLAALAVSGKPTALCIHTFASRRCPSEGRPEPCSLLFASASLVIGKKRGLVQFRRGGLYRKQNGAWQWCCLPALPADSASTAANCSGLCLGVVLSLGAAPICAGFSLGV